MEWNKVDKDWKKQLDERTIAPSAAAWNKLSQQLDNREKKKKRGVITTWMGIAACLVVGGLIGLLLSKAEQPLDSNTIHLPTTDYQVVVDTQQEDVGAKEEVRLVETGGGESKKVVEEKVVRKELVQAEKTMPSGIEYKRERIDTLVIDEIWVKKTPPKVVVDSNDLLEQVEGEIEVEYRETKVNKLINTAKKVVVDISDSRYEK
ncbi:hypothetical protein [Myroides fluvii]|uniref:hypothetical protein n=1 Tax=Myroides fluvii TaxID=2572594 RepID=UPI00131BF77A|nr:hypothetical protein [Myroides fluvii]